VTTLEEPLPTPGQLELADETGMTPEAEKMGEKVGLFS